MTHRARATLPIVLLFVIPACREPEERKRGDSARQDPGPAFHAVRSDRLKALMQDLEELTYSRVPQGLDEERKRVEELADVAARMAEAASGIPRAVGDVDLSDHAAEEIRFLASELGKRASRLKERAQSEPVGELRDDFLSILSTCNDCHARFRALPGFDRRIPPASR